MKAGPPPPFAVLRGHDDAVVSLKFGFMNNLLSGGANGDLKVWALGTLRSTGSFRAHEKSILSICILSRDEIVTASRDSTIKIWNGSRFDKPAAVLRCGYDHFCNTIVVGNGNGRPVIAAPGIEQSQILLWDSRELKKPSCVLGAGSTDAGMLTALGTLTNPDEQHDEAWGVCAGYEDGSVHVFDTRKPDKATISKKLHSEPVFTLTSACTSRGRNIVSGGGDVLLRRTSLLGAEGACALEEMDQVELPHPGTSCARYRSDGRILVTAHWDHAVRVYDRKHLKPLAVLRHHRESVYTVEFADTVTSSAINAHRERVDHPAHAVPPDPVSEEQVLAPTESAASCSPAIFATGSKDNTIALWDTFADSYR